ncbi:MAG TPA: site-2 protease family protein [Candidatus Paceibacterota bacterium]|nr:site-2 protease family protein [Candidatus Paceibacterota bacterium]
MTIAIIVFEFVVLLFSAVLHEVAHGYEAERLGDDTARNAGRLTLNPLKHLDPFLSFFMPVILFLTTGFFFAGAKPVPYNPNNLKNPRVDAVKVAFAGPVTNLFIALVFGMLSVILPIAGATKDALFAAIANGATPTFSGPLDGAYFFFLIIVYINVLLGIFNLVPIPPLDGSKLLFLILPPTPGTYKFMYFMERWGLILVLIFVFFGFEAIFPVINFFFALFTGRLF